MAYREHRVSNDDRWIVASPFHASQCIERLFDTQLLRQNFWPIGADYLNYAGSMTELPTSAEPLSQNRPARTALAAATIAISAILTIPAFTGSDDFPISSQPMFATPRSETAEFVTARGINMEGQHVELPISEIAQTDDPLVAEVLLRNAERTNDLATSCQEIAGRTDQPLTSVEIVRISVNLDDRIGTSDGADVEVLERCQAS